MEKVTIFFERTTASKCPLTFKVHGTFEGLPPGGQLIRYRLAGAGKWKSVKVPGSHDGTYTTVLETLAWDAETGRTSVQVELAQPGGLTSNTLYYFECGDPPEGATFGEAAEPVGLTRSGGPVVELVADAYLDAVQAVSGAEAALVNRYGFWTGLDAGSVTYQELFDLQPAGLHVDVYTVTGAELKRVLAHPNPVGWVLTPSASLRYTLEGGAVTELTLNGAPVADTQVLKIAANYVLVGGGQGWPRWEGSTAVYRGGPDDRGALASYIAKNTPVPAPQGDRVTMR
ncbi:5'-nucleotidase C-terminal domain-containing protein [Nonomuraea sp. NPDC048826]|uniref:5'-nucleotidase C-terminal domain-containing protein n=1 Tax=Nonomuraea sp. NPDC048826 TaxID=3364347 RepID=UPI00371A1A6E